MKKNKQKTNMIIFGGTGDLTNRKLIPALYQLHLNGYLPKDFSLISIGRRNLSNDQYQADIMESTRKFSNKALVEESFKEFSKSISYFKLDFDNKEDYKNLLKELENRDVEGIEDN